MLQPDPELTKLSISFLGDSFIFVGKRLYGDDESDRGSCSRNLIAIAKKKKMDGRRT